MHFRNLDDWGQVLSGMVVRIYSKGYSFYIVFGATESRLL